MDAFHRIRVVGEVTATRRSATGVYTELQCGSYIFIDPDYRRKPRTERRPDQGLRSNGGQFRNGHQPLVPGEGFEPPTFGLQI